MNTSIEAMSKRRTNFLRHELTCICLVFGVLFLGCSPSQSTESEAEDTTTARHNSLEEPTKPEQTQASEREEPTVSDNAFRFAAYDGKLETVQQALASGINVNSADSQQKLTALHMAAYNGHSEIVQLLLQHQAQVDPKDHEGKTPLIHACTGPFAETVEMLLEAGADINAQESTEGFTPLMMAAGLGEAEVVKVLLRRNADRSIRDNDQDRAVDHARNSGHAEIIALLSP